MALSVPTTQSVSDTIVAQLEASIAQTIPLLPKAFIRVLAKVLSGVFVILYKYGGFIFLQLFVSSASMDATTVNGKSIRPLVEWGRLIGLGDPYLATRAELSVTLVVKSPGGTLLGGQQFLFKDTQIVYQAITQTPITGSSITFTVRATYDPNDNGGAGTIGNLAAGATIDIVNGPPNVASSVTVVQQTVTAADDETPDAYRARILQRFQQRPQGGAAADYKTWALDVPGIINVYPYKSVFPGVVEVYVEADVASSGNPDGIPTTPQLNAVFDAIQLDLGGGATRRPVNDAVAVLPITRTSIDIVVAGLASVDDVSGAQAEIHDGVDEYLRSREPFIVGLSVLPRDDRITIAALSGVVDEIVSARGGTVTRVDLQLSGSPFTALTLGAGQKAKLGLISWI